MIPSTLISALVAVAAGSSATVTVLAVTQAVATPALQGTLLNLQNEFAVFVGLLTFAGEFATIRQRLRVAEMRGAEVEARVIARLEKLENTINEHAAERREAVTHIHASIGRLEMLFVKEAADLKFAVGQTIAAHIRDCPASKLVR